MYEIVDDDKDGGILSIICTTPSCSIPLDPTNLDYQKVLDDIIEQGADCFEGDIPTELQTAADAKQFAQHLESYTTAIARLAQYVIADGRTEVVESLPTGEQVWNEETEQLDDLIADAITVTAIDPVDATIEQTTNDEDGLSITTTIENPLITQDNAERAEAQAVVDTTPQAVIDTYNGE
jgi:hypothetical protein